MVTAPLAKIELIRGNFTTTWSKLTDTAGIDRHLDEIRGVNMDFMDDSQRNFRQMMSIRALRFESQELDLHEVIQAFGNTSCQNPRDKIFASLCIAPSSAQNFIIPDYSKMVSAVYLDVARYYLAKHKLDFLGFATRSGLSPSNFI